ncbi:MAG: baseplate J/gp47 family protein [Rhodospirillaceae bacterium]|nr:baseplate J/gp47 family protein [Rhodospirillales bacterium]
MKAVIDLSRIAPPDAVRTVSMEAIVGAMKADLLGRMPELTDAIRESDPSMKIFEGQAVREGQWEARVNASVRAVMVAWAKGADLENLVAGIDMVRQVVDPGNPDASPPVLPTYESDDRLRRRCVLYWNSISNGAPEGFYPFLALDASADVYDADSTSPAPCEIVVHVLPRQGGDAAAILAAVQAVMADMRKVPQGDRVSVQAATVKPYRVVAELEIAGGPDTTVVVETARTRTTEYTAWSEEFGRTPLGRSISVPLLHAALAAEGVRNITLLEPLGPIDCAEHEAARCTEIIITVKGAANG